MAKEALLQELEELPNFAKRTRRMLEIGRAVRNGETSNSIVEELVEGSVYDQFLSLETVYGSRDVGVAIRGLGSSSKLVKRRSLNLIIRLGADEDVLTALNLVPDYLKLYGLKRLKSTKWRANVIDEFLESLENLQEGGRLFQSLLPHGSASIVEKHLPQLLDRFSSLDWTRLAKYHPEIVLETIHDWMKRSSDEDPRLLVIANQVTTQWTNSESTADMALDVIRTMIKTISLKRLPLREIIKKRPIEVVDIILSVEERLDLSSFYSWPRKRVSVDKLLALFDRYSDIISEWDFRNLNPDQRRAVYAVVNKGWRDDDGVLREELMENLPADLRIKEARRHVKLKFFEPKPIDRVPYIAFLPWDEAMELQMPFLRSSDAESRTEALRCQITAAKYDKSRIGDALNLALKCQYERSTVRDAVIMALSDIPVSWWKEEHLDNLDTVIRHALDASDLAKAGPYDLLRLATGLISFHPRWASKQVAIIMKEHSGFVPRSFKFSGVVPTKEVVEILAEEMDPWLMKFLEKAEDQHCLAGLGRALETNVRYWPALLDSMEKVLLDEDWSSEESALFPILKKFRPRSWFKIIPDRLSQENSTFLESSHVIDHIHRHDQSLLAPILKDDPSPLYTLKNGFVRWSPDQQRIFGAALVNGINDEDNSTEEKQQNIKQLAQLLFIDIKPLVDLADAEAPIVREGVIRVLGRVDSDKGAPTLFQALQDDRSRFAIYSMRNTFKSMSKIDVLEILKGVPMNKVTVAKEAVRLIGELDTEQALSYLLTLDKTDLYTDVRVALFRALWLYLERDEPWDVFARAARDADPVTAKAVYNIPDDGLSTDARNSLLKIFSLLIQHPSAEVRLETLERLDRVPLQDPGNILLPRLFELLQSPFEDEIGAAARAVFKTYTRTEHRLTGEAFQQALKNRKNFRIIHAAYLNNCDPNWAKYIIPTSLEVLSVLKSDRLTVTHRLEVIFEGLLWNDLRVQLLDIIPELHADALVRAEELIADPGIPCALTENTTKEFELELTLSGDERARRLALAFLVEGVSKVRGWNNGQRGRLLSFREDESVMVAEAAWKVSLPEVDEEDIEDQL